MKKTKVYIILGILIVIVGITGFSYALWSKTFTQTGNTTLASDCFNVSFTEDTSSKITLLNSFPITDEAGKNLKPYTFSITNNCNTQVEYYLNLETTKNTTMKDEYIRLMLNESNSKLLTENKTTEVSIQNGKNAYLIDSGFINGLETKQYNLRIWMDSKVTQNDTDAMNATFESKISITGKYSNHYYEPILNGTDPIIKDNLIAITISNDGTVKKADREKSWYSYENKVWANAIILEDKTKTYKDGEIIPEANIESYFVWIPRYKYKLFSDGNYANSINGDYLEKRQEISIIFENKNTPISKGTVVGQYLTHPAFTTFDSNGMWIGKFETGYQGAISQLGAAHNGIQLDKIEIKPNVYAWNTISPSNAHLNSYNYQRDLDSHMMKNTEWGCVTYLSQSKYGINKEIRLNNNLNGITGYSAVKKPIGSWMDYKDAEGTNLLENGMKTEMYHTEIGVLASTSGNISGIYDMAGGLFEIMMGFMKKENGQYIIGRNSLKHSGFNGILGCPSCDANSSGITEINTGISLPNEKYFDIYPYTGDFGKIKDSLFGDGMKEYGPFYIHYFNENKNTKPISSWNSEIAIFYNNQAPIMIRGGRSLLGDLAGIFNFDIYEGDKMGAGSYRIILSI